MYACAHEHMVVEAGHKTPVGLTLILFDAAEPLSLLAITLRLESLAIHLKKLIQACCERPTLRSVALILPAGST